MGKVVPKAINNALDEDIISNSFPVKKRELPDDVEYNQNWWKWYCQENKLDVNTGKSLRGGSYLTDGYYTLF